MGQNLEILKTSTIGDVLLIDTDRSLTGQDGHVVEPGSDEEGVVGKLATDLFGLDIGIDHIYVLQNTITVRRPSGWDEKTAAQVGDATSIFLRYYGDEEE